MQHNDSERPNDKPTPLRAGPARFVAVALIAWGAVCVVTSAIRVVNRVVPVLVVTAVLVLVVTSKLKRRP